MINQPVNTIHKNVFEPLQSNGESYAISKPFTEEQKDEFKMQKKKRFRELGLKIFLGSLFTGLTALGLFKGVPNGLRLKFNTFLTSLTRKTQKMEEKTDLTSMQKIYLHFLENIKTLADKSKVIFNTAPLKDIFVQKTLHKHKSLKKISDNITDLFERISLKKYEKAYSKSLFSFDNIYADYSQMNKKLTFDEAEKAEKILQELKSNYISAFSSNARRERYSKTSEKLNGLFDDVWNSTYGNLKGYVSDKKNYQTFISEEKAAPVKVQLSKEVMAHRDKISANIEKLLSVYKNSVDEKEYLKIENTSKKSIKILDKAVDTEIDKLFDKLRDLKLGSAPSDVLSILTSTIAVILGLAHADNHDERTSIALKTGVPILGGMMISLYCTVALVSAGPSLIIGTLSGLAISKLGEILDKIRKKENNLNIAKEMLPEDLIPTLKDKHKLI